MNIVKKETHRIAGQQTIIELDGKFFLVSSVKNSVVDKTFILKCDENGKVKDYNEVYTISPSNHSNTLDALESEMLTTNNFNFVD